MTTREFLDDCLSRALNVPLSDNRRLQLIDKSKYVLTLDYAVKMLNIHERYECGIPVILEGETGVGKTELLEMLNALWNDSIVLEWRKAQRRILHAMEKHIGGIIL